MSHRHCHPPAASVGRVETLYSWGYCKYSHTQWTRGETHSGYKHQIKLCTPTQSSGDALLKQHEDDCLFCKMLFFYPKKFIGWQLLCLVSADSCEVCNNVNHKTDIGHVSVTSNLPGSPGKTGDDKKPVKSVNRGNWITLLLKDTSDSFPFLFQRTPLKYHSL